MPLRLALAAALLATSSAAPAAWHVAESDHFVVYADDGAGDVKEWAESLERYDAVVRLLTGMGEEPISPSNRVTVFLVDDLGDLKDLYGAGRNSGVAGFYTGRASGSYAFAPRRTGETDELALTPRAVLQHEYAHHLMLATYEGAFPAWLVEGWAEFYATTRVERDGRITVGAPPLYRAYGLVVGDKPLRLTDMVAGRTEGLRGDKLDALYGRGWALTHLLTMDTMKGGPRAGQYAGYLRALGSGQTGEQAAATAFGDLKVLDRELDRYLRHTITALSVSPTRVAPGPVTVRALRPGEAATMPVRMRSKRGVDEERAPRVLADARAVAARFPDDPFVLTALAEAEFDAGQLKLSLAAATRAVALDPKATEAMIYQGRARLAMLARDGGDAAAWDAARRPILAANALENDDAEPLMLYYQSFVMAGEHPSANAVAGLMRSQALAPQDTGLRLTTAHQLLVDGDGARARRMLGPVAFNPHGGDLAVLGRALVERLDAAGPAAALAFMDQSHGEIEAAEEEE